MQEKIKALFNQSLSDSIRTAALVIVPASPIILLGGLFTGTFTLGLLALLFTAATYVGINLYAASLGDALATKETKAPEPGNPEDVQS